MIIPPAVTDYLASLRPTPHPQLDRIREEGTAAGLPIVDPHTGALLHVLALAIGARRVLEIGTAIGYSTLWLATAMAPDGMLITLERDEARAARAREHFAAAGVGDRVTVMIGDATRYLHKIAGPFDLIFQDADKTQYEPMLARLIALLRPGGMLVTDNVLWSGGVIVDYSRRLAAEPQLTTTFLPVGDGVSLSVKTGTIS